MVTNDEFKLVRISNQKKKKNTQVHLKKETAKIENNWPFIRRLMTIYNLNSN